MKFPGGGVLSRLISGGGGSVPMGRWARSQAKFLSFFLPAAILLIVLVVYPIVATLALSFVGPDGSFIGFANYGSVVGSPDTFNPGCIVTDQGGALVFFRGPPCGTLLNNLIWIGIHLPLTLFMGLFLALLLQNVRGASYVKSLIFLGMVTPLIVVGVVLRFILEFPIGLVPNFFGWLGVNSLYTNWLASPNTLLLGLIFGTVWSWTGFSMIVYSAGLTTIPKDYFEAARVDGASEWQIFRKITWPLLRPVTLVVVTMTLLWELKLFDIVIGATNAQGGVSGAADVLALQMYRYFFTIDYSSAAVVATLLTIFTLIVAVGLFRKLLGSPRAKRVRRAAPSEDAGGTKPVGSEESPGSAEVTA
jgi:multiple sugar transport system permease protein